MTKEAVTTVRLSDDDAKFVHQQVAIVNALADDPYRRQYTAADLFRMLIVSGRRAYEACTAGTVREDIPPFVEWWQVEFSQFLLNRRNQEFQQAKIAPRKPLLRGGDAPTPRAGRLTLLGDRPFRSYKVVA